MKKGIRRYSHMTVACHHNSQLVCNAYCIRRFNYYVPCYYFESFAACWKVQILSSAWDVSNLKFASVSKNKIYVIIWILLIKISFILTFSLKYLFFIILFILVDNFCNHVLFYIHIAHKKTIMFRETLKILRFIFL